MSGYSVKGHEYSQEPDTGSTRRESTREGLGEMESERDFPNLWPSCGTFLWRTHAGRRVVFPQHLLCAELSHLILNTALGDRHRLPSPPNALDYKLHEGK